MLKGLMAAKSAASVWMLELDSHPELPRCFVVVPSSSVRTVEKKK
jgi:hypothetical protein